MVECANPLPDHCVEEAGLRDPKILSLSKEEKLFFKDIGHCERLIPTTSPKAISNYTKFFGGWCNFF